jgi:pimeloyl-ACP methyl ester carboxylesterase
VPKSGLDAARSWLLERLERRVHPLDHVDPSAARATIESLSGIDPESWAAAWGATAERFAAAAEQASSAEERRATYEQAYAFSFLGRYPVPNHPAKERQYERARAFFGEATQLETPPVERVVVSLEGRDLPFYLARPHGVERPPVVMVWGGIDTWKEEMHFRLGAAFRAAGCAVLLVDMPGVGESPILASRDAERQWTPIFDWLDTREDLDRDRRAAVGASFGGYWAQKLAYTHRERLRCCVNWGGGVHITFTREWQERSREAPSYLMDLMAARARIFGGHTFEEYAERCSELSLLEQGLLERPSAELLLVNGRDDRQNSIDDLYLSLDYGDPKAARVFDGGHMGEGPVGPTIVNWVRARLER